MLNKDTEIKVNIETALGEARTATKFSLAESTELERLIIVQNIFTVMGVDNSLTRMIDDFRKVGEAYESFFREVDPIESESKRILPLKNIGNRSKSSSEFADKLSASLQKSGMKVESATKTYSRYRMAKEYDKALAASKALKNGSEKKSEEPEHYRTGIIESPNGNRYQCRMICTKCNSRKTLYVALDTPEVFCRECGSEYPVRNAKTDYMKQDSNNNFFIAGSFVGEDER